MNTEIRPYRESDYAALKEMVALLYREDPEGEPMEEEKLRRTIDESGKNPEKIGIYLFFQNNEAVGYGILVYFWSNEYGGNIVTIDELFVKEAYRGRGIGREFLAFLEGLENKAALQLETTPSNVRALDYYRGLGFVPSENTHLIKKMLKGN